MILAVDAQYDDEAGNAVIAGVLFETWGATKADREITLTCPVTEPYVAGEFYKRELPLILALVGSLSTLPDTIIVDGYVDLDLGVPGLGRHLHTALEGQAWIIGIAKSGYAGSVPPWELVFRGASKKPLYVTATERVAEASQCVVLMAGEHRIPSLLKRVDQLARGAQPETP